MMLRPLLLQNMDMAMVLDMAMAMETAMSMVDMVTMDTMARGQLMLRPLIWTWTWLCIGYCYVGYGHHGKLWQEIY